ncbi:hypothetical protein PA598K_02554 [Paenibacillus sp. 598K]|uniref:hypothetical protein n=1 Tax=Paenibacillus sp. 598K TaxID=1117987 RepID=UPI000FF945CC|nr:hypothetical protein [Paenibacillus sp. 598K]GBF74221.1 hypothetical protein PA598K_02554 [Paenibacillus sp. 598K]
MNQRENEAFIIARFRDDEQTMIAVFAQWCVNKGLDPLNVYRQAYPGQPDSPALLDAIRQTVVPEEARDITDDLLFTVLGLFGNDDLSGHCADLVAALPNRGSEQR